MFKITQEKALKKVLAAIKKKTTPSDKPHGGRTPYKICRDYGIPRSHLSGWLTGSRIPTEDMKRRIVEAVREEAVEAKVDFPIKRFKEFLTHDGKVA